MTRILLVDADEAEAEELGRSLLGRPEREVVRAATLLDAIRVAGESTFDAAILDTDLPDGSGLDILDFLRIGSPGIHIVLLSARPGEDVALHALSHGAGDFLVKDKHLERELARRVDALLDERDASAALVETLAPLRAYDARGQAPAAAPACEDTTEAALSDIVGGNVLGAGVWDLRGRPLATRKQDDVDDDGVGFALASIHLQIGSLWTHGQLKPTGYRLVVEVDGGVLAVTAIPGTYMVALLLEPGTAPRRALDRVEHAGQKVLAALQEGTMGDDLPAD